MICDFLKEKEYLIKIAFKRLNINRNNKALYYLAIIAMYDAYLSYNESTSTNVRYFDIYFYKKIKNILKEETSKRNI